MLAVALTFPLALAQVEAPPPDPFEVPEVAGPQRSLDPDQLEEISGPQPGGDPDSGGGDGIRVLADRVRFSHEKQVVLVEGNVEVHQPPFIVLADRLRVNLASHRIRAEGRVRIVERNRLMACQRARLHMPEGWGVMEKVRFEIRDQPVPLERARVLEATGNSWPGALWLFGHAREVRRNPSGSLTMLSASVTPCDCGDAPPSWELSSERIEVVTDEGAWAYWPVLRVMERQVLALPAWYIPLSDRQSGLLAPQLRFKDGLWWLQPIYLTLGRSADATLSPGVVLERGPRAELELRWAPAEGSAGQMELALQWDEKMLRQQRIERTGWWGGERAGETVPAVRGAWRLQHASVGRRWAGVMDLRLTSDRLVTSDYGQTLGSRVEPYVRSAAQLSRVVGGDTVVGANAALFQDLRQQPLMFFPSAGLTPYKAPVLFTHLLPVRAGPVLLSGDADLTRLGLWGDGPPSPQSPLRDDVLYGVWRGAAAGKVSWPWRLDRFLHGELAAAARQALFATDEGQAYSAGAALLQGRLATELVAFQEGEGFRWRHAVQPFIQALAVPARWTGGGAWPVLDSADRFAVGQQLRLGVSTAVHRRRPGEGPERLFELTAFQGLALDVAGPGASLADTVLSSHLQYRGLGGRALVAVDPTTGRVGAVLSSATIRYPSGLMLRASYDFIGAIPADYLYAADHELFGDLAIAIPSFELADRLALRASAEPLANVAVSYGVELALLASPGAMVSARGLVTGEAPPAPGALAPIRRLLLSEATELPDVGAWILTHGGSLLYRSQCRCWEAGLRVRFWPNELAPDVHFVLTVSGFGEQVSIF